MTRALQPVPSAGIIDELQDALARGSLPRRVELLRRVTDLFLHGAGHFADDHISMFDDVFECLVANIHHDAQAMLSARLAPVPSAPRRIIRHLAMHDLIEVAAPVLAQSDRIDEDTLIEAARSRSQAHLIAIAGRRSLSGGVAEVLIERGDDAVVRAVAIHPQAEFTDLGYRALIDRADRHDWIATCVAMRPDMPRHHFLRLVAKASDAVRTELAAQFPDHACAIDEAVKTLAANARTSPDGMSEQTEISHRLVRLLHEDGRLDDRQVAQFAEANQFDEVCAALSCLARIPLPLAETMMLDAQSEGLFILGKVCDLSWPTVQAIVTMHVETGRRLPHDLEAARDTYARLRPATAQQVLRFHRMEAAVPKG